MTAEIGLIGLAVMGQNLVMNIADHGFTIAVYNRTTAVTEKFTSTTAKDASVIGTKTLQEFVDALKPPRRIIILVRAGDPVDATIDSLKTLLAPGDIIIDGGNSHFRDTERRSKDLAALNLQYVGCGVSGGEEGARNGPSLMPGGSAAAWPHIRAVFQAIAAKVSPSPSGEPATTAPAAAAAEGGAGGGGGEAAAAEVPCCDWIGPGGSGHYVKMVHNGIEYGDMQIIAEAYHLLLAAGYTHAEMAALFARWNTGPSASYLIEITAEILAYVDPADPDGRDANDVDEADAVTAVGEGAGAAAKAKAPRGAPLVPKILDAAEQKGTGKWTAEDALALGVPLTLIADAVFARIVSSMLAARRKAAPILPGPRAPGTEGPAPPAAAPITVHGVTVGRVPQAERAAFESALGEALYAAKIVSYAQGFLLLRRAAAEHKWGDLNYGGIALLWRGGCIIRSVFLGRISEAFNTDPTLDNIMLAPFFTAALANAQDGWRATVARAALSGVPAPALSGALSFYDSIRSVGLPASLTQAQRDYFGAHTYALRSDPTKFVHTNWTGRGGDVTSNAYTV